MLGRGFGKLCVLLAWGFKGQFYVVRVYVVGQLHG